MLEGMNCQALHRLLIDKIEENKPFTNLLGSKVKDEIDTIFSKLYYQSLEEKYPWDYCPFEVYKNSLDEVSNEYLKEFIDGGKKDFFEGELFHLESFVRIDRLNGIDDELSLTIDTGSVDMDLILYQTTIDKAKYSHKRKMEFVKDQITFESHRVRTESSFDQREDLKESVFLQDSHSYDLADRYYIANSILDLNNLVSQVSTSQGSKYKILSLLLSCNVDNARKLFNNQYAKQIRMTKGRKETLDKYITSLKIIKEQ
jgi:hypothetical protein